MPERDGTVDGRHTTGQAARNSFLWRLVRTARERRQAILTTLAAAAATVLLMAGSVFAWRFYDEWRRGRIELTSDGAPVVCQVLAETSDDPIGEPFDLITRAVVSLPAGDYRLRVNGKGRIGRTYRFAVNRGETQSHSISIDEGRLLGGEMATGERLEAGPTEVPRPFAPVTAAIELTPGRADLIELSRGSLIRFDCTTMEVLWDAFHPAKPLDRSRDAAHWMRELVAHNWRATLVEPAPDLNGDGTRDLLWSVQATSAFLALSGRDGSMLWNYAPELDGAGGPQADGPIFNMPVEPSSRWSELIGAPVMADVDRDGSPDLIATTLFHESRAEIERRLAKLKQSGAAASQNQQPLSRRVVVAVSGRSGRWLWSYPIDRTFRPFSDSDRKQAAALVPGKPALVAIVDDTQWFGLDPASGRLQVGPIDLGLSPIRPVQHADLDGDGEPEVLSLGFDAGGRQFVLAAANVRTGRRLWAEAGTRMYEVAEIGPAHDWPLVTDLDGDGRSEIVIPVDGVMPPLSGYRGVRLLDGLTGKTRWARPMRLDTKTKDGLAQMTAAPDLDGDGSLDVVTVSLFEGKNPAPAAGAQPQDPARVYVDALSGKGGRPLWWWSVDLPPERFTRIGTPSWWGRGPDGWPMLAVPIGGRFTEGFLGATPDRDQFTPPVVHLLEATTGKEMHTIDWLTRASLADLNGDGLADLWGEVAGELRAFRGEAPEAWRALGTYYAAASSYGNVEILGNSSVDLDGDGIADTLIGDLRAPGASARRTTGSHTALARSGRDGHVIWKAVIDPQDRWFEPSRGEYYSLRAFPLPEGDFNGDGTPDVIVDKDAASLPRRVSQRAATLPLQLLSGRTGGLLWNAGPLPLGFEAHGYTAVRAIEARAVEPGGEADLFVRHGNPFAKASAMMVGPRAPRRTSLARISGRDGHILWDVPLAELPDREFAAYVPPAQFDDLDGDRGLDAVLAVAPPAGVSEPEFQLLAVSLREGKKLWSRSIPYGTSLASGIHLGDLDGDQRSEVVVMEAVSSGQGLELAVRAFDGRDGKPRWTWNGGKEFSYNLTRDIVLANLDGNGIPSVCASFKEGRGMRRIVVLDRYGHERTLRDVAGDDITGFYATDSNGDGRDELLFWYGHQLRAWDRNLSELWSWPTQPPSVRRLLPAAAGRGVEVVVHPALALDGATGRPRWVGQPPMDSGSFLFTPSLLDPGDAARPPLLIGNGLGATVCRVALPMTPQGAIAPPRGTRAPPSLIPNDPRWTRPLPWVEWLKGPFGPWGFLAAGGLALFTVVLPLSILRLVTGRRRFSIRALMALPVAAAFPLMVFLMLEPVLPVGSSPLLGTEKRLFIVGMLAGLPIVFYGAWIAWSLARLRWRPALALVVLTMLASLAIGAAWLRLDMKSMPAIEHYGSDGWYLVLLLGAYAASLLMLLGWAMCSLFALLRRTGHEPE